MTKLEERQRELLREARNQIAYLQEKFGETGSGHAVLAKIGDILGEKWGCHCELEDGEEPDECVLDISHPGGCVYAMMLSREGKGRDDCEHWRRYQ